MADLIGRSFGRYHILEQLGEGGMATVYKAYDTRLETDVAVKVIRTDEFLPKVLERALKRFEREAKALAKLNHPNIVKVIDYGEYEGSPYLVMPYLSGGTLKRMLSKPMPWQEAVKIILPIARALDYAHRQGMVHRDVKPSNILITEDGDPLLTDFGIAKIIDDEATLDLTGTSATVGTPEYMAPEQVTSRNADHRADIYALGVVLYEMVTGRKLYTADTPMAVLFKHASEPLPRPTTYAPDLPEPAEKILLKALAKKPEDRYQSMAEFANALESMAGRSTVLAKPQTRGRATTEPAKVENEKKQVPSQKQNKERVAGSKPELRRYAFGAGILLVVVLGIFGVNSLIQTSGEKETTPTPTATNLIPTNTAIITSFTPTPQLGIGSTMTGKDGMTLLYVPAGEFEMGSDRYDDEKPVHTVYLDSFWIDQTEVTNAMYAKCVDAGTCGLPAATESSTHNSYYGNPEFENYPVVFVDWKMAGTYCSWAGRRLPTEAEWEKAASWNDLTKEKYIYPWGNENPNNDLLNFNEVIGDTTKVGSYPDGASPYGVLDMAGNVDEWVYDGYDPGYYETSPSVNPQGPSSVEGRIVRGGSWILGEEDARSTLRFGFGSMNTSYSVGFRCAMDAETPASVESVSTNVSTGTVDTAPTLGIGSIITGNDGMTLLYVPAGEFEMGSNDGNEDQMPVHTVYLDAFWIDQTEVTNAMYAKCVQDSKCDHPSNHKYYSDPSYSNHPIVYVTWNDAIDYCSWAGRRLPTEAEWEKVASWNDLTKEKFAYPWGNEEPSERLLNYNGIIGDTTEVGTYPDGASPYGALDMSGNIWEWVADWYGETYYASSPTSSPLGPDSGQYQRVLRGGSNGNSADAVRSAYRNGMVPTYTFNYIGFRCAMDANE